MKIKVFFTLMMVTAHTFAQVPDKKGVAQVNRVQGKEAYIMCEPLRTYDVVFDVGAGMKASSLMTGGLVNEGVSAKAAQFVKKAIKEAEDSGQDFDAVVYSTGKRIVAVQFTDENIENSRLGEVQKVNGKEVYVLSEPLREYEVKQMKGGGIKLKSYVTGGIVNNSIEQDIADYAKKLMKKNSNFDAIIYSNGKKAISVKFTE